jgi:hypothetical protein
MLNATGRDSSSKISPTVPGALDMVTDPANAAKNRTIRMVVKLVEKHSGIANMKKNNNESK